METVSPKRLSQPIMLHAVCFLSRKLLQSKTEKGNGRLSVDHIEMNNWR